MPSRARRSFEISSTEMMKIISRAKCMVNALTFAVILAAVVAPLNPAQAQSDQVRREVNLNWGEIEGATVYEIEITRILGPEDRKEPLFFKIRQPAWKGRINPGQYEMRLRSYDDRGVPGEWSEPSDFWVKLPQPGMVHPKSGVRINTNEDEEYTTTFKWHPVSGAERYRVVVKDLDGKFSKIMETKSNTVSLELNVAKKYQWQVVALLPDGVEGEKKESFDEFSLIGRRLDTPEIDKPLSKFVRLLTWDRPDKTQNFSLAIHRRMKNNRWKMIVREKEWKDNEIPFDLSNPSGTYRIIVKARSPMRRNSKTASRVFEVKGGFRSPAAVESAVLLDSINKPSNFYGIASYFITVMDYAGANHEISNNKASFPALGGTGRIGLGYQNTDSLWGYYGVADLSGFTIGKDNFTFAAIELHATYSMFWGSNQLRLSSGAYLKEFPEVIGNREDGLQSVGKIRNIGPHLGLIYWRPISQTLGFQINTRFYYAITGDSPTGEDIESTLSMQFGILGSYRFSENLMGFAGYAYRQDNASYRAVPNTEDPGSFASPGDSNTVEIQGHYLNLVLEYSF